MLVCEREKQRKRDEWKRERETEEWKRERRGGKKRERVTQMKYDRALG